MNNTKKVELKLHHIKKHDKIELSFEIGNLYLITGENNVGKTTVLNSIGEVFNAKCDTKNPISFGENKGRQECTIVNKDGSKTDIIVEYERGKAPKFKILYPDTKTSTKPTDIRDFAKFNDFTVDEFFSWGHTAEGRRKQADILLLLIKDKAIVKEINEKSKQVITGGELYKSRTAANSVVEHSKKLVTENTLDDKELAKLDTLEEAKTDLEALRERHLVLHPKTENVRSKEVIEEDITTQDNLITRAEDMIKQMNEDILNAKAKKAVLEEELKQDNTKLLEEFNTVSGRITAGEDYIGSAALLEAKNIKFVSMKENYDKALKESQDKTKKIEQYRKDIKALFTKANYPVDDITIEDGEAFFVEKDGNKVPFVESDLSYSKGGSKIVEILMELNKELPIILLGKASEYDGATKDKFAAIAKDRGYIMIADSVVEQQEELEVVVWDLDGKDVPLSNKKKQPSPKTDKTEESEPIDDKPKNELF